MIDRTQATEAESIALRLELAEQRNRVTSVEGRDIMDNKPKMTMIMQFHSRYEAAIQKGT